MPRYQFSKIALLLVAIAFFCCATAASFFSHKIVITESTTPFHVSLPVSYVSSVLRVIAGGSVSFIFSLSVSLLISELSPTARRLIFFIALLLAITPPSVWNTISIMMAGLTEIGRILTVVCSVFFLMSAVNIWMVNQLPSRIFHIAELYQVSFSKKVRYILLPEMREAVIVGLRIGLLVSWIAISLAELVAVQNGLGAMLALGRTTYDWIVVGAAWLAILSGAVLTDLICVSSVEYAYQRGYISVRRT